MAFWSPPASADPDLKQQLFDFKVCENLPERTFLCHTQLSDKKCFSSVDKTGSGQTYE